MSEKDTELAILWLKKARNDIVTARQTLLLQDGPTDTVCFHAQQAAEKSLKALLTARGVKAPRLHDLLALLDVVSPHLCGLDDYREALAEMTAYAIEIRYPGDSFEPDRAEAEAAVQVAEEVLGLIQARVGA